MSTSRSVTVWCDGGDGAGDFCGQFSEGGSDSAEARRIARHAGWSVGQPGGRDFCVMHRANPPEPWASCPDRTACPRIDLCGQFACIQQQEAEVATSITTHIEDPRS